MEICIIINMYSKKNMDKLLQFLAYLMEICIIINMYSKKKMDKLLPFLAYLLNLILKLTKFVINWNFMLFHLFYIVVIKLIKCIIKMNSYKQKLNIQPKQFDLQDKVSIRRSITNSKIININKVNYFLICNLLMNS